MAVTSIHERSHRGHKGPVLPATKEDEWGCKVAKTVEEEAKRLIKARFEYVDTIDISLGFIGDPYTVAIDCFV
jgi:hypothetical protein